MDKAGAPVSARGPAGRCVGWGWERVQLEVALLVLVVVLLLLPPPPLLPPFKGTPTCGRAAAGMAAKRLHQQPAWLQEDEKERGHSHSRDCSLVGPLHGAEW